MDNANRTAARLRMVDEHIAHESAHRLEPLVATFGAEPEWHDTAGGQMLAGDEAIRQFYAALFHGFPDFWLEVRRKHVAADAVIVEGDLGGTHQGEWMNVSATGRKVRIPFCAVFTFTADDKLKAEIVYYDRLSLMSQLGVIDLE
jgi:steroid delta-isomerase-like uncharacterized protein